MIMYSPKIAILIKFLENNNFSEEPKALAET